MTRKLEYKQYLKSEDWQELRNLALVRTDGFCQYCGEIATQVHHVKYPKRFGEEHPHSLIPICDRCHEISHGVQKMNELTSVIQLTDLAPTGNRFSYLLSGGRVYASSRAWNRALEVPDCMAKWFESGLERTSIVKKDSAGGSLSMQYSNVCVYRWHAVGDLLRAFDREFYKNQFSKRPIDEQRQIEKFHNNYERLVNWGYDLQERAMASILNVENEKSTPVTQENLVEAIKQAVAPRLRAHDDKLNEHDVIISEIKDAVPTLRDPEEFITVKQAVVEQGRDANQMPYFPDNKDTLSGLIGKKLKSLAAEQGSPIVSRLDGQSFSTEMNTYRRREIYKALEGIK